MPPEPPGPVRTCVGCRTRAAKTELLRVVLHDGALVYDPAARRPGRGAYLHPDRDCLALAVRRRAFGRALRAPAGIGFEVGPFEVALTDAAGVAVQSSASQPPSPMVE